MLTALLRAPEAPGAAEMVELLLWAQMEPLILAGAGVVERMGRVLHRHRQQILLAALAAPVSSSSVT